MLQILKLEAAFSPRRVGVNPDTYTMSKHRKLQYCELLLHVSVVRSQNIIRVTKPRRMRWTGHVARMGEQKSCTQNFWLWNLRERDRLENLGIDGKNIKIYFHEIQNEHKVFPWSLITNIYYKKTKWNTNFCLPLLKLVSKKTSWVELH